MSNILICHTNRIDAATLSNGSWTAGLPLPNIQDDDRDLVARSTNANTGSTMFAIDMGANRAIRAVALDMHNLSTSAVWRVKAGTSAPDSSNVFASGEVLNSGQISVKRMTFYGDTPTAWGEDYLVLYAFNEVTARYVTVNISDTSNADGYVQIGRVFVGNGFQPTINPQFGMQHGHEDLSTFLRTEGGKRYYTVRPKPRWVSFALPALSETEGDKLHEIDAAMGVSSEVLYVPDPADMAKSQRYGFIGNMRELGPLEDPFLDLKSKPYRIDQKL